MKISQSLLAILFFIFAIFIFDNQSFASSKSKVSSGLDLDFDYYMFSQFYLPSQCNQYVKCDTISDPNDKFVAHGLWPSNYNNHNPSKCQNIPYDPSKFSPDLLKQLSAIYGGHTSLMEHEWEEHGVCTDLDQVAYFTLLMSYFNNVTVSQFIAQNAGNAVNYSDLVKSYNSSINHIFFVCTYNQKLKQQSLREVRTAWSKDGNAIEINNNKDTCTQNQPVYIPAYPASK
jgi:ribonuclease I